MERKTEDQTEKPLEQKNDDDPEFKLENFIDALREVNNEVLQMVEIKSQTERLKLDIISYIKNLMSEYKLTLEIAARSLAIKNLVTMHLNDTGIVTYHFRDGSIKSFDIMTSQTPQLLNILNSAVPQLKEALKLKRKGYEEVSNLLSKIGKITVTLNESNNSPEQHPL